MKKLYILAALLTAATSRMPVEFRSRSKASASASKRRAIATLCPCIKITAPGFKGFKSKRYDDDDDVVARDDRAYRDDPPPAKYAPAPAPVQAAAPQPAAPVAAPAAPAPAPTTVASAAPVQTEIVQPAPAPAPVAAAPAPQPAPVTAAPAPDPTSPLGVWSTEENKGNVRIEPCGANLCGYAVKTGEKILISMKPSGSKWTGQIHDPDSGRNYDSTIALKGETAAGRGRAFGGMPCGGQTWKRVS